MTVQQTIKLRIGKQIVDVNCPPYASGRLLDEWLKAYLRVHPDSIVISKSWSSPDAAA